MHQVPEITLFGTLIQEPTTVLTDWLITFFAWSFAVRLNRHNKRLARLYAFFFIFMGLSTFAGGIAHAFNYELGRSFHRLPWLLNAVAIWLFMLSSNAYFGERGVYRVWEWSPHLYLALFAVAIMSTLNFAVVGIFTAVGILGYVLPLHLKHARPTAGKKEFFAGLAFLIGSALVAALKLAPSPWFNHNDFGHILMIFALYQFYKRAQIQAADAARFVS